MGLLCICQGALIAQAEEVDVDFSITTLSITLSDIVYDTEGVEPFSVVTGLRSPRFKYTGAPDITFYRLNRELLDDQGKPTRIPIGSARVPSITGSFLFILKPLSRNQNQFRVAVIPDGLDIFKPGMYRFINTAPFDIALKIGESTSVIKSNGFKDIDALVKDKNTLDTVIISMVDQQEPIRAFRGGLRYSPERRFTYIISEKNRGRKGQVNLMGIPERVSAL
ncbi:MAG: hypothetical protein ACPGN3_13215 [Opitutales bacterium]